MIVTSATKQEFFLLKSNTRKWRPYCSHSITESKIDSGIVKRFFETFMRVLVIGNKKKTLPYRTRWRNIQLQFRPFSSESGSPLLCSTFSALSLHFNMNCSLAIGEKTNCGLESALQLSVKTLRNGGSPCWARHIPSYNYIHTHIHTCIYEIICLFTPMRDGNGGALLAIFWAPSLPPSASRTEQGEEPWVFHWCIGLDFVMLLFTFNLYVTGPRDYTLWWTFLYTETHCFSTRGHIGQGGLIEQALGVHWCIGLDFVIILLFTLDR